MQPLFVTHFFNHAVTARRLLLVGWLLAETFNFIFYLFCFFCHLNNHHECSCYFCSLHLCQDVLLVGFFFLFYICVVLCCCPLWRVCLHGFGFFFHFCLVFCWLWKNQREKVSFFGVFYGWFLFVLDFLYFISALRYFTFVGHECVECEF